MSSLDASLRAAFLGCALLGCVPGCSPSTPPPFVSSATSAGSLTVYVGVPRDPSTASEAPRKTIADQEFYAAEHAVAGADARAIAALLDDASVFRPHVSGKKCGGFHADYAVEWPGDRGPRRVLLCFGCGEARSIGDGIDSLVDLTEDGESRLEAALGKAMAR